MHSSSRTTRSRSQYNRDNVGSRSSKTNVAAVREGKQNSSPPAAHGGGPGRTRTSNQTVMSGGTRIAGVDFPEDLTRSIVFVASCCDRFWCETGAVIAACLREAFDCLMVMWTGCGKRPEMR